jgi:hypothetical protein
MKIQRYLFWLLQSGPVGIGRCRSVPVRAGAGSASQAGAGAGAGSASQAGVDRCR